jgi:hypothetical protein
VTLAAVLEVGLAASLIQRPDEPRDEEYQTLFTLQILAITALVLLIFVFVHPGYFPGRVSTPIFVGRCWLCCSARGSARSEPCRA